MEGCALHAHDRRKYAQTGRHFKGVTGEMVCVRKAPDLQSLAQQLKVRRGHDASMYA